MIRIDLTQGIGLKATQDAYFDILNTKLKKARGRQEFTSASTKERIRRAYIHFKQKRHGLMYVYEYLLNNFREVITDEPQKLVKHMQKITALYKKHKLTNDKRIRNEGTVARHILKTLGYESFSGGKKSYRFINLLNVPVCPYCNRQWITTVEADSGKVRATLDHFFSKEKYPYLSMSLFNLVPSCYSCNSSLKGRKEFSLVKNIHPYIEDFNGKLHFSIGFVKGASGTKKVVEFYKDEKSLAIELKADAKSSKSDLKKAKKNSSIFQLEKLYAHNKDYVVELVQKSVVYNATYINDLAKKYPKLFNSPGEVKRLVYGNYTLTSDLNKRPLAKLTRDICLELSLPI